MLSLLTKKPKVWLLLTLSVWLCLVLWWSRGFFVTDYDLEYMAHLYDHSQWRIPLSPRVIADDQIYPIAGVHQFKTGELFTINPEVPPLGKYIYGAGALWLGNPYIVSVVLYLLTLLLFYGICSLSLEPLVPKRSSRLAAMATLLLATSFLMTTQITQTMLDLPHLFVLSLSLFCLLLIPKTSDIKKQLLLVALAGLCIGLFSTIKIAVFTPAVVLASWWWLRKHSPLLSIPVYTFFVGIGFYIPYLQFILAQPNIIIGTIEFLKTQKWVLDFYTSSNIPTQYGMVLISAFSGLYKGWWEDATWQLVNEHSILWPLGIGSLLWAITLFQPKHRGKSRPLVLTAFVGTALLLTQILVPFWPRYFLLILPWGLIGLILALQNRPRVIAAIIISSMAHAAWMSQPLPHSVSDRAELYFSEGLFQDMYSIVDTQTQKQWQRDAFFTHLKHAENNLQTEWRFADITVPKTWPWETKVVGSATFRWHTKMGVVQTNKPITFIRENNTWRVLWEWDNIIPGYSPEDSIMFESANHKQGVLRTRDGWIVSQPGPRQQVVMTPDNVRNTAVVLEKVALATDRKAIEIEKQLFIDSLPDEPVAVGLIKLDLPKAELDELSTLPGVSVETVQDRAFSAWVLSNPTYLQAALNHDKDNPQLKPELGGMLFVKKANGQTRLLLERPGKPGENAVLTKNHTEL